MSGLEAALRMAYLYCTMIAGVIGFQVALIFGAPWGRLTQGGQVEGALPLSGRLVAAGSIMVLACMALAILLAAGRWPGWAPWTGWAAVAVNAVSMMLNWITPSRAERRLWAPIMTAMCALAFAVVWI